MSCYHIGECMRCTDNYDAMEGDRDRLLKTVSQIKEQCSAYFDEKKTAADAIREIEFLTACGLDPANKVEGI